MLTVCKDLQDVTSDTVTDTCTNQPLETIPVSLQKRMHIWYGKDAMKGTIRFPGRIHYWYAEKERKARDWDLKYMKKFVPDTVFKSLEGMDHGDKVLFYPERMAQELREL